MNERETDDSIDADEIDQTRDDADAGAIDEVTTWTVDAVARARTTTIN